MVSGAFRAASFAFVVVLVFAFALLALRFSDVKGIATARSVFSGHVAVLLEDKFA
jgi:hypothetical protein